MVYSTCVSIILTLSYKGRWYTFSFHIWSAIPDFSISPRTTAFRCSSNLIFCGRHVSPLYTLLQLQELEYTQFLIMLNSVGGLTRKSYLWRVEPLVNIVLIWTTYLLNPCEYCLDMDYISFESFRLGL